MIERSILCLSGMKDSFSMDYEYLHSCYNKKRSSLPYRPPSVSQCFVADPESLAVFTSYLP